MTDVMKVVKEAANLKPKQWVRLKRGVFKDDLAQIDFVEPSQNQVHVKLIPRIDYSKLRGHLRGSRDVSGYCSDWSLYRRIIYVSYMILDCYLIQ